MHVQEDNVKYKENSDIYQLGLHESLIEDKSIIITRVPGGWLYQYLSQTAANSSPCFVPFSNEFSTVTSWCDNL